ncbi:hypothetical protein [Mammaliicoccus lentus]|uniref:hypothetical protein n=1 Tax=Mammaliicoccus lentus TaxID=42858 RepID=UPI002647675A|nr:hypothetical protein [Mammaliicoccus lentus]
MTDDQFVGLTIMFVVLCVTLYKMHKNSFNHKKTKSSGGLVRSYETKINNPPEPPKPTTGEDNIDTYYVVEVNGRYYENETVLYSDAEIFEHNVSTTKSLLECKRFYSKEDAQEIADKHGFAVRKVRVECE